MTEHRIAGLELGGTKCLAIISRGREIIDRVSVPTTTPDETLGALDRILSGWSHTRSFDALGIASFGPIALDPSRPDHGRITTTPKPGWANTDILGRYRRLLGVPTGFDTDVTGAAIAEYRWGAARGTRCNIYLTVGTGVGGGAVVNGRPLRGLLHPEMGHVRVRRDRDDAFAGACPYHGDCVEGLVSGPAIARRAGRPGHEIPAADPVWRRVADEMGELLAILALTLSPQHIALGGGVMIGQPALVGMIRAAIVDRLAGYVSGVDAHAINRLVTSATFGVDAGPLGAIALGLMALEEAGQAAGA